MANLDNAVDYILYWEDAKRSGVVTEDQGGKTRWGLSQRANGDLTDENFYGLSRDESLEKAVAIYKDRYCVPARTFELRTQEVANKILDMYVNIGTRGVKFAQRAVGQREDGIIGPNTLNELNSVGQDSLLNRLARLSCAYYDLLEGTPDEHKSWLRRGVTLGDLNNKILWS